MENPVRQGLNLPSPSVSARIRLIPTLLAVASLLTNAHAASRSPTTEQLASEARAQRIFATQQYLSELRRAERITYVLLKAGAPYCANNRKYSLGVPPLSADALPEDLRTGFMELSSSEQIHAQRFMHVAASSPLERAGIKEGDILLSLTDQATGKNVAAGWTLDRPLSTLVQNELMELALQRGKDKLSVTASPQLICDARLKLERNHRPYAQIEASNIVLSTGLLHFLPNDNELALLLANELLHEQIRMARSATSKRAPEPKDKHEPTSTSDNELQADYLSAYLIVAAGFDLSKALNVWKRIGSEPTNQGKDALAVRQPVTVSRLIYLQSVAAEIRSKMLAGLRVIPDSVSALSLSNADFGTGAPSPSRAAPGAPEAAKEDPRLRSIADVPFINNEGLAGYQRFLDSPLRPRAFAIGPPNKSHRNGIWNFKFGANASADALAACALVARGPCYLYAVDDAIVWNPETAQEQPETAQSSAQTNVAHAPAPTNFAAIADISAVPLPETELQWYRAFLEKPSPRAFIITQKGTGRYWIGPAAMHDALAYCARTDDLCWLYAVNDAVVWSKDPSKRISNRDQLPTQEAESGFLEN